MNICTFSLFRASEGEDPIGAIQDKVNKTTETMKENIKEVLKREENLKTTEVTTSQWF